MQNPKQSTSTEVKDKQYKVVPPYLYPPQYRPKTSSPNAMQDPKPGSSKDPPPFLGPTKQHSSQQHKVAQPVRPPQEKEYNYKPLRKGDQLIVYMTHNVDPQNFFVRRASCQSLVENMTQAYSDALKYDMPSLKQIVPGRIFLTFIVPLEMWQRGRVLGVNTKNENPTVEVFCVDYGNIYFVSLDSLRFLPASKIEWHRPLAIRCSLYNCEPTEGKWTGGESELMNKIIDNKRAVMHVRRITYTQDGASKFECDIRTLERGINIARALVFHECARWSNPPPEYQPYIDEQYRLDLFKTYDEFDCDIPKLLHMVHVVSPGKFYVRNKCQQLLYKDLIKDLDYCYSISDLTGHVYLPEKGMAFIVNLAGCGPDAPNITWSRGVVMDHVGNGCVQLLLPDCGNVVQVHWTKLAYCPRKFISPRPLATECYLAGIAPLNKKWSPEAIEYIKQFSGNMVELKVESYLNSSPRRQQSFAVILKEQPNNENLDSCINDEMVKLNLARSLGSHIFNKKPNEEQSFTNDRLLDTPEPAPPKSKVTILKEKKKGAPQQEIKFVNIQSPSLMYISFVGQQDFFHDFFIKLQKYYSNNNKNNNKEEYIVGPVVK